MDVVMGGLSLFHVRGVEFAHRVSLLYGTVVGVVGSRNDSPDPYAAICPFDSNRPSISSCCKAETSGCGSFSFCEENIQKPTSKFISASRKS